METQGKWPRGKKFAFSIFDDTDEAYLENAKPVYDLLNSLGIRTTKSVWPLAGEKPTDVLGATLEDPAYLDWIRNLQEQGFEIALHNVSYDSSPREKTEAGLERFRGLIGHYPKTFANHYQCQEGLYWGADRLSGFRKFVYNILTGYRKTKIGTGHLPGQYFWGDLCRDKIHYVRNFVYWNINTLEACPFMPYFDAQRPYARAWFASTEARDLKTFLRSLSKERIDTLEASGGACILYTHIGYGFSQDGRLVEGLKERLEYLASKDAWFAPVSEILEYLEKQNGLHQLRAKERALLEWRWLVQKLFLGST